MRKAGEVCFAEVSRDSDGIPFTRVTIHKYAHIQGALQALHIDIPIKMTRFILFI